MRPTRLFFAGIMLFSLLYLTTTLMPDEVHAVPKSIMTGEYPEAVGARCMDVDYKSGQTLNSAEGPTFVTSPNPDGATVVSIGLYVDQITGVDESTNSFVMQGLLDLIWCDARLAFDANETGTNIRILLEGVAQEELNHIWWPNPEFVNKQDPISIENLSLLIHADGTIEYRSKFSGHLASIFNLHAFPFDEQDLLVEIESFEWASDTMTFLELEEIVGFSEEFHIPEWYVTAIREQIQRKKEARDQSEFSEFVATIHVKRDPGVYTTKVMIPLGVIILISMIVFWMDAEAFEDRLSASMTGLLTAVAYQFIASQNLPKHVYNTYLDSYVFLSFLIILFGIGESAFVRWLTKNEKVDQARQVDKTARWFMPLLYLAMIVVLYFSYTS
jgi:Neurotransmitter-gated ion-channel ligand binding domain